MADVRTASGPLGLTVASSSSSRRRLYPPWPRLSCPGTEFTSTEAGLMQPLDIIEWRRACTSVHTNRKHLMICVHRDALPLLENLPKFRFWWSWAFPTFPTTTKPKPISFTRPLSFHPPPSHRVIILTAIRYSPGSYMSSTWMQLLQQEALYPSPDTIQNCVSKAAHCRLLHTLPIDKELYTTWLAKASRKLPGDFDFRRPRQRQSLKCWQRCWWQPPHCWTILRAFFWLPLAVERRCLQGSGPARRIY